jgi:hypothetical protein
MVGAGCKRDCRVRLHASPHPGISDGAEPYGALPRKCLFIDWTQDNAGEVHVTMVREDSAVVRSASQVDLWNEISERCNRHGAAAM